MPLAAIVSFNSCSTLFALHQAVCGYFFGINCPPISAKEPDSPLAEPLHQRCESGLVTIATFPVNELTGIATISFPDPEFVFFECK